MRLSETLSGVCDDIALFVVILETVESQIYRSDNACLAVLCIVDGWSCLPIQHTSLYITRYSN